MTERQILRQTIEQMHEYLDRKEYGPINDVFDSCIAKPANYSNICMVFLLTLSNWSNIRQHFPQRDKLYEACYQEILSRTGDITRTKNILHGL